MCPCAWRMLPPRASLESVAVSKTQVARKAQLRRQPLLLRANADEVTVSRTQVVRKALRRALRWLAPKPRMKQWGDQSGAGGANAILVVF